MSRFQLSALFPFALSSIAFALVIVLVLSGTTPDSLPDVYLLSFNTTSVGQDLIEINPTGAATTATPAAKVARDVHSTLSSKLLSRAMLADSTNATVSTPASANLTSAAPVLAVPQTTAPANPAAIPITLISAFFQLTLNTLATGMGPLQNIVTLLVTTGKQTLGVSQYYTMHLSGVCMGSVTNATGTNSSSPFNVTRCVTYHGVADFVANSTRNVSDSVFIAATNITLPLASKVPTIGRSGQSLIDSLSTFVTAVFVIVLIGNGISILLSAAAFVLPTNGNIRAAGAAITTLSTQLLQAAAITSTSIAVGLSSGINKFSDVTGLRATVGGKFLALVWVGYIAAQIANGFWVTSWFMNYRTTAFKARQRTSQQMSAGFRDFQQEIKSDFRVEKVDYDDMERLTGAPVTIEHWQDNYQKI